MSPPRDSAARSVSTRLPVIASDGRWRNVERTEVVETSHQRLEGAGPSIGLPALSGAGRRNRTCSLPLTRRLLGLLSFPGDDGCGGGIPTRDLSGRSLASYQTDRKTGVWEKKEAVR